MWLFVSLHDDLYLQRAVVSMSRETEENISRILQDVRRHSDTGFTDSSSFSDTGMTSSAEPGWTAEENCTGMETEPSMTSETGLTGVTSSASISTMELVDVACGSSRPTEPLFFVDNEGEGLSTIEQEIKNEAERLVKLNEDLKSELEEKEKSNPKYRKMMVGCHNSKNLS